MDTLKKSALLVIVLLSYVAIMYYTAPRVDYIVENGKEIVISVDGKPTWRPLSKDDITDSILTKK